MLKNIEIFICKDQVLFNQINMNLSKQDAANIEISNIKDEAAIDSYIKQGNKITSLIIFDPIPGIESLIVYSQNIINFSEISFSTAEIKFRKPFKLFNFLSQLRLLRLQYSKKIFCRLNKNIIFDSKTNNIIYAGKIIKLTDKETEIIKLLLHSPNYSLDKAELLDKIWGFTKEIDTNTLETHFSKLKQKLPFELIIIKDNFYSLKIYDLQ
ncbi:MAG: Response regulator consisting of a CheY-like receiver domain and a winged-helix DNA-binding domain [Rickettsiaceae bacterium]|jgi:hypothetical protein|nr:Response regulator consisting of a CheY-like receiver domain and a winged-helix DNA-binding domain [Rickettsiaceae bacterium]